MNRKEITQQISKALEYYINPRKDPRIYYAKEVTFNYGSLDECRVDYMLCKPINNYTTEGIENSTFTAYEIKSSVADFNSGHGCNWYIADKSYLVTLPEVFEQIKDQLPDHVGCIVLIDTYTGGYTKVVKRAKKYNRTKSTSEMLLMMFRSSNRELYKLKRAFGFS